MRQIVVVAYYHSCIVYSYGGRKSTVACRPIRKNHDSAHSTHETMSSVIRII